MHTTAKRVCNEADLYTRVGHPEASRKLLSLVDSEEVRQDPRFRKAMARAQKKPSRFAAGASRFADVISCVLKVPLLAIIALTVAYWLKDILLV